MPPHSSHLLQPLDVGCFSPLKKAYGRQVEDLIRSHINHITKIEFLPAFKAAFDSAITGDNIRTGFRGAGLVPFNPDAVISKLEVRLRTPTAPPQADTTWESKTPSNPAELGSQSAYLRDRISRDMNSSPTSIIESLNWLTKGAELIAHSAVLLRSQVAELQEANEAATRRRSRKRKQIKKEGVLTLEEGKNLIAKQEAAAQQKGKKRRVDAEAQGRQPTQRRCGRCGLPGHNARTCQRQEDSPFVSD
jgi:hypothetical protein